MQHQRQNTRELFRLLESGASLGRAEDEVLMAREKQGTPRSRPFLWRCSFGKNVWIAGLKVMPVGLQSGLIDLVSTGKSKTSRL